MIGDDPTEKFNVCQFFANGMFEYVRRNVTAEEAVKTAHHYTNNVATKLGMTERVIITDTGDCCCWEWKNGEGITFPPELKGRQ
jgi:hypothetical protein